MKRQLILFMLFTMFIFLAACGTETNLDNKSHADSGNENEGIEEQNGTNKNVDTVDNDEEPLVENQNENTNVETITETGIYNGQADPHTIEIETSSGPLAFQLTMEMREVVEKLNVGEEVKYFYTEDGIYREIQKIETTK